MLIFCLLNIILVFIIKIIYVLQHPITMVIILLIFQMGIKI